MATDGNPIEAVRERLDGGRRWIKGSLRGEGESVCILGAMLDTNTSDEDEMLALHVVREQYADRAVQPVEGYEFRHPIALFNDHPATVWEDVELVPDKASVAWDEAVR